MNYYCKHSVAAALVPFFLGMEMEYRAKYVPARELSLLHAGIPPQLSHHIYLATEYYQYAYPLFYFPSSQKPSPVSNAVIH